MNWDNFESGYKKYEQTFIWKAREDFDKQPFNNKVQYLRGVYRYLLLNRLLARKEHTVRSVLHDRYSEKNRSSEQTGNIISRYSSKLIAHIGSDMFEQMRIDAARTLYDVFPDATTKWGQYIASAVEGIDIKNDRKFGLTKIRKNTVIEYAQANDIHVRNLAEAQKANASNMSRIKKKQSEL
jgi:hypothetical protein